MGIAPLLAGRWRFAAHLGISSPDQPLLARSVGDADPVRHIERAHELGFAGITDNGLKLRPADTQVRMAAAIRRLGMEMGTFTHSLAGENDAFFWGVAIPDIEAALAETLATAERIGGGLVNLILLDAGTPADEQQARAIENFCAAAVVARERGVRLGLEAISRQRMPQALFDGAAEAVAMVRAVGQPGFGLIIDSCHMAYAGDDIAGTITANADILAAVQIADVPGRVEPGAGEVDFVAMAAALDDIGWEGLVEAEFHPQADTDEKVIGALAGFGLPA